MKSIMFHYWVSAMVRERSALGIFYKKEFLIVSLVELNPDEIKEAWFKRFGHNWDILNLEIINKV